MAIGDAEEQGLFNTGAGSVDLPPDAEHPDFVMGIFYTAQTFRSSEYPAQAAQIPPPQVV